VSVISSPRTAEPLFGPNAPYADQSIATGVDLTEEAMHNADGQIVVAGHSLGASRPTPCSGVSTRTPTARRRRR
jgi:hypothetical protein